MDEHDDTGTRSALKRTVRLVTAGLLVAAVVRELSTPAEERTWHGRVGPVPYDLRPPTLERIRAAWWNPEEERIITPRPFGVGWAVNLPALGRAVTPSS